MVGHPRPRPRREARQLAQRDVQLDRAADLGDRLDPGTPGGVGRVAQQAERRPRVGVRDDARRLDPLAPLELDARPRDDPGHRSPGQDHGAGVAGDVAEDERDHAHPALDVSPHPRHPAQPARLVVEVDRRRPRVVRAGERADDPLPEIGRLEALVVEEMLDVLDHRPVEQDAQRLGVSRQPALDLVAGRSPADPEVAIAVGPQCVAQPALHVAERPPARQVAGREPRDLLLAQPIVVPELDARAVLERDEQPGRGRRPSEPVLGHPQLVDHQRVEQSDQVGTGRDPSPRPDLLERAGAPHAAAGPPAPAPAGPPWPGTPRRSARCARRPTTIASQRAAASSRIGCRRFQHPQRRRGRSMSSWQSVIIGMILSTLAEL